MSLSLPPFATLTHDPATSKALITVADPKIRKQREMWGTLRAQLANHITGVSEGHVCILRLVGVGYRASVEDRPAPPGYADLPNAANKTQKIANRPLPPFGSRKQDTGRVRAKIDEKGNIKVVNLKVQYAHPVELPVPEGVDASCPVPTRILLQGKNKQLVKQFAAEIREWRKPEPYKGKGIFVDQETIKLKNRKIK